MKVVCNREKLREGLAIANNVIPAKAPKPVLENVCLVATDSALELVGTDLEVAVRYRIDDVQVEVPGPVVIPARTAMEFVRDLSGETVTLEAKDTKCIITSGSDSCELVTVDPDEFPVISRFDGEEIFSMQGGTFTRLVGQTVFAAAKEPGRYAMHGVLTAIEGDLMRMVATDGRRLALSEVPLDSRGFEPKPVIVPTKGLQLFCRVIADPLDQIELHLGETQIGMRTKNAEIFARLIEGEFPRYSAVIPTESSNTMRADRETLTKKLRLVSNVAGDEARAARFSLSGKSLELFGRSTGRGEAKAHMEVEFTGADSADIAFNPDFVLEGLKNCQLEEVVLEFADRTSPGKFLLGENHFYIVMPITVDV